MDILHFVDSSADGHLGYLGNLEHVMLTSLGLSFFTYKMVLLVSHLYHRIK